jgi:catechol 2,3-dioxygenase-like lactoylglutathione lyase family enzyme
MNKLVMALGLWLACTVARQSVAASPGTDAAVSGVEFVGRMIADLDRSINFYRTIGFTQDRATSDAWRTDHAAELLYGVTKVQFRSAKMTFAGAAGRPFVLYLQEVRGIARNDMSNHTPWEPGATHFGLVVPDAAAVWDRLRSTRLLKARSWNNELIVPPGQSKGLLAYMTDPDGLDIELIDQRPATPADNGRPARPALLPGVTHAGLIILSAETAQSFYGSLFGGQLKSAESPWMKGDFYDSVVGGHGNVLRFFNESYPESESSQTPPYLELVEFQNRKKAVRPHKITDVGVGYVGFEVRNLDTLLKSAEAAGAHTVSTHGIVTWPDGTREVMIRDPDVGMFVDLYQTRTAR